MLDRPAATPLSAPRTGVPASRETDVIDAFLALADTSARDFDLAAYFRQLAASCAKVTAADAVWVMMADDHGELAVAACWPDWSQLAELAHNPDLAAPYLESFRHAATVAQPNLTTPGQRWPEFAVLAMDAGFHAVHALPVRHHNSVIGAISLLHAEPGPVAGPDLRLCAALAETAAISLQQQRLLRGHELVAEQIQAALSVLNQLEQPAHTEAALLAVKAGLPRQPT